MLDDDHKEEIRKLFNERDEAFEAKQELAIMRSVAEGLRVAEATRRSRMQFVTAIGGATAIGAAVLIWSNITTLVDLRADDALTPRVEELQALKSKFDEKTREISALTTNVNDKLGEIEKQLDSVRFALGALQTAEGGSALSRDLIELNRRMNQVEFGINAGGPAFDFGPRLNNSSPEISDCINPDGTFKSDC